ncbi:hypothetical protein RUM43_005537 [Polyplax serrata]|uniref:Uncharacterized protein n=1 Tax=Polyplax serrata TaxID=468196 RepID=A0AAN8P047_POLSC
MTDLMEAPGKGRRPGGQSGEIRNLTEVTTFGVIKNEVETRQPGSISVVETISIASQTDPIKNLSPVLPFKGFQNSHSKETHSPLHSDEEAQRLEIIEEMELCKNRHVFFGHRNCDLDMDLFRSCRKLSVLPEEDNDESFNKNSFKIHNKTNTPNFITHSADDLFTAKKPELFSKEKSSSMATFPLYNSNLVNYASNHDPGTSTNEVLSKSRKLNSEQETEIRLSSAKVRFAQPHSLDSYLNPQKQQNSLLTRQMSDPCENTTPVATAINRKGNHMKKSRSTCRPLRLPCEKDQKRKEDRVCKVRFDLSGVGSKDEKAGNSAKPVSNLKTSNQSIVVSRFRVETVDEAEFRKSLDNESRSVPRKRLPVLVKQPSLNELSMENLEWETEVNSTNDVPEETCLEPFAQEAQPKSATGNSEIVNEICPSKKRRQSELVPNVETTKSEDILVESIKLHTDSSCIVMKELKKEPSVSSESDEDVDIPYIDAEDLPVLKPGLEAFKMPPSEHAPSAGRHLETIQMPSAGDRDGSIAEGPLKSSGLSKSPTVLKNLANFELFTSIFESNLEKNLSEDEIAEENGNGDYFDDDGDDDDKTPGNSRVPSLDVSEASESDTLTYGTVRSHLMPSSDCDSDTYVTVWSDKSSILERKFSDLSENSSSPYNTPPEMSSAGFYTPPDTYSPILNMVKKHPGPGGTKSPPVNPLVESKENFSDDCQSSKQKTSETVLNTEVNKSSDTRQKINAPSSGGSATELSKEKDTYSNYNMIFDSPKLEFYESNDSVENLENFLLAEEGLSDRKSSKTVKRENLNVGNPDLRCFDEEDSCRGSLTKMNSFEGPDILLGERRGRRYPPLSKQNSTEEYTFLEPHDSCLNLSEEMSSPSTTPDTSNKTVIFNKIPLTVSNTIDLEDEDDFPTSETEITNLSADVEVLQKAVEVDECVPEFRKQNRLDTVGPPDIILTNSSSESDKSEFEIGFDLPSNVEDLSDNDLSDVDSLSTSDPAANSLAISPGLHQKPPRSRWSDKQESDENSPEPRINLIDNESLADYEFQRPDLEGSGSRDAAVLIPPIEVSVSQTSKAPEAPVSSNRRISNGIPNSNAVIQGAEAKENEGNRKVKTHFNSSFNAIKSKKTREMTEECCPGAQGDCSNNDLVQQILRMFSGQLENLELLRKLTSNVTDKGTLQKYQSSPCCAQGPMNGYCVNVDTPIGLAYQENENKTPEKERCSPSKKELMTSESHHPRNVNNNIVEDGEGEKSVSSEISAEEANGKAFKDRGRAWKWKTIGSFCRFLTKLLVFALLFLTGALTGMNGFFSYTHVKYASLWLGVVIFLTLARRFYRFLFVISSVLGLQLVILVVWVGPLLLAHLTEEEMNKLFRPFHPFLQVRYANGPPPV